MWLKLYEILKIWGGELNELYTSLKEFRNLPFKIPTFY